MAEIKSTLELAMERTKKFALTQAEKEAIKEKEITQKAVSLGNRYLAGYISLNEVLKETDKMEEKTGPKVKELLLIQWVEELSLRDEAEQLFRGIEALKQRSIDEEKQAFLHLLTQYRREKEKIEEEWRTQSLELLKRDGIYGSAVEPRSRDNALFQKETEETAERFFPELKKIKERLKKS